MHITIGIGCVVVKGYIILLHAVLRLLSLSTYQHTEISFLVTEPLPKDSGLGKGWLAEAVYKIQHIV